MNPERRRRCSQLRPRPAWQTHLLTRRLMPDIPVSPRSSGAFSSDLLTTLQSINARRDHPIFSLVILSDPARSLEKEEVSRPLEHQKLVCVVFSYTRNTVVARVG